MGTNKLLVHQSQKLWELIMNKKWTDEIMILDSLKTQQEILEPNETVIKWKVNHIIQRAIPKNNTSFGKNES